MKKSPLSRGNMVIILLSVTLLTSCIHISPFIMRTGPAGEGWVVYAQTYSFQTPTSMQSQSTPVGTAAGGTTRGSGSEKKIIGGNFIESIEKPRCQGYEWVKDCKL